MRKEEDYKEPEVPKFTSFQGTGRKMTTDEGGSASSAQATEAPQGEWQGIDENQPATSIQIRLADGSRMVRATSPDLCNIRTSASFDLDSIE